MAQIDSLFNGYGFAIAIFAIVFVTLLANLLWTRFYRRVEPLLKERKKLWERGLVVALYRPLKLFLWVISLSFAFEVAYRHTPFFEESEILSKMRLLGSVSALVWFFVLYVKEIEEILIMPKPGNKHPRDETTVRAISQLLRVSVLVTSILISLQAIGIPVSGVVAFGGIGGIAVGFAAKDLLANFFGGLMVFLDRPFSLGDWIRSPDREIEGMVEHIGWRTTRIRTFDRRPLFVPNSLFSTISIENPSRMHNRRIKTFVGVRYQDACRIEKIVADIKEMLRNHEEIAQDRLLIVNFSEFGPSSLNIMVYTFTKTTNWVRFQEIQEDIFLKVINIITANGAECAFPTTTIHIPDGALVHSEL